MGDRSRKYTHRPTNTHRQVPRESGTGVKGARMGIGRGYKGHKGKGKVEDPPGRSSGL